MKFYKDVDTFNRKPYQEQLTVISANYAELASRVCSLANEMSARLVEKVFMYHSMISNCITLSLMHPSIEQDLSPAYKICEKYHQIVKDVEDGVKKKPKSQPILPFFSSPGKCYASSCPSALQQESSIINPDLEFEI